MKPRAPSMQLERAAAHLLRARAELDEAAHALTDARESPDDLLTLAAQVATEQARLVQALTAAIHAAPHSALENLLAAITGDGSPARSRRH